MVIVEKKNGSLRLCLDPKDLNCAIKREHYRIPTADDIASRMSGKKVFSILDQKDGFWQMRLDEPSSKLCTFNTPFGRYRFLRCPFGISSAPEVFQKRNDSLFGDIDGVEVIFDDIIIAGKSLEEHDQILETVLDRARVNGVKFNPDKFQHKVSEVKYIGNIVSCDGLKADPEKVKALAMYPKPQNKTDLQRFFGMVNYLGQFIPNLSAMSQPLRLLLKGETDWFWAYEPDRAFEAIKSALIIAPVLQFFDVNKDVLIQCDASSNGLGACLLQEGKPVAYASRSLTVAEQNYAQIEKELLASRSVNVHSDHRPLETITHKSISKASPRLQRMLLRLQKYTVNVIYKPGREMHIADALSRAYLSSEGADRDLEQDMEVMVHSFV